MALTPREPNRGSAWVWTRVALLRRTTSAPCAQARVLGEGARPAGVENRIVWVCLSRPRGLEVCTPELGHSPLRSHLGNNRKQDCVDEHVGHGKLLQDRVVASPLGG